VFFAGGELVGTSSLLEVGSETAKRCECLHVCGAFVLFFCVGFEGFLGLVCWRVVLGALVCGLFWVLL
jgi:hypothetical protein